MTNSNNINETKFLSEAIIKGYSKPISKKWDANHFNDTHINDVDLFLYWTRLIGVGLENNNILNPTTLTRGDSIEVFSGQMHY